MTLLDDRPSIAFRVDASGRIGTGHVMRCLTLAAELAEKGCTVCFICRAHESHMGEEIRKHGHELILLPLEPGFSNGSATDGKSDYASWLGAGRERDAQQTVEAIAAKRPCWLIADHYAIDAGWEQLVKDGTGAKVMVIDGLANRKHDCDLLLDQTYSPAGAARWDALLPAACQRLVGPQFAIMRPEFVSAQKSIRQRDSHVRRIFIAFGGIDEPNATAVALKAVAELAGSGIVVDVVVGAANPHRAQLLEKCGGESNVHLHVQPDNMAELMANADLAISAGGTLLLEQCFMQLPSIVVSIAANQIRPAQALHDLGAVLYIGDHDADKPAITENAIRRNVSALLAEPERLIHMQAIARELMKKPGRSVGQFLLN